MKKAKKPSLSEIQQALEMPPKESAYRERQRLFEALREAASTLVQSKDWPALFELRAWAVQHPLFATPKAPLFGFLRIWEQALLAGAPLQQAAALVHDGEKTALADPWEHLAARASWQELRPLLKEDRAAYTVAEARVLRGERLGGRSPFSGMPLLLYRFEPKMEPIHYSVSGRSWSTPAPSATLTASALPGASESLEVEPEWHELLSLWGESSEIVKVKGSALHALSTLDGTKPNAAIPWGRISWRDALRELMATHAYDPPYGYGRGMALARRAVWRLLAALSGTKWPPSGGALQAAMSGFRWYLYDPRVPDAIGSLFVLLEDSRRGLAWGTYAWVTD